MGVDRVSRGASTLPTSSWSPRSTRTTPGSTCVSCGVEGSDLAVANEAAELAHAGAEVAVDFTVLDAARENLHWCAATGVHAVVGTTGFDEADLARARVPVRPRAGQCGHRAQLRDRRGADDAVRRARGAVLRDRRDHRAAPRPEGRRAVGHRDAHGAAHRGRVRRVGRRPDHARSSPTVPAAAGSPAIPVHSVRLRGLVAHQEVLLGTARPDPVDPPRLLRPLLVHARSAARGAQGRGAPRPHGRARSAAAALKRAGCPR